MDSRENVANTNKIEVVICSDGIEKCCGNRVGEQRSSFVPGTPDIIGESRDPLIPVRTTGGDYDSSPHTPKEDVFDPFAPGIKDLLQDPRCKKWFNEWRMSVARSLDFGSSAKNPEKIPHGLGNGTSDEEMVERVYESLLETIFESKIEDILTEFPDMKWAVEDFETPASAPKLNGIAETCPGAPLKAAPGRRNIDLSLCRKLWF